MGEYLDFHDIESVIEKLEGRIEVRRAALNADDGRLSQDDQYRALSQMLYKMRSIRDAVLVTEANGFLH